MTLVDYAPYAVMVLTALVGLACWAGLRTLPRPQTHVPSQTDGRTMMLAGDDGSVDLDDPCYIELVD